MKKQRGFLDTVLTMYSLKIPIMKRRPKSLSRKILIPFYLEGQRLVSKPLTISTLIFQRLGLKVVTSQQVMVKQKSIILTLTIRTSGQRSRTKTQIIIRTMMRIASYRKEQVFHFAMMQLLRKVKLMTIIA